MAFKTGDHVRETTTTTGTGSVTLAGAATQAIAFSTICSNGDNIYYCIQGQSGGEWEVGLGTWNTGGTITRTASNVLRGSSGVGTLVSFSAGTKDVFVTLPADRALQLNDQKAALFPIVTAVPSTPAADTLLLYSRKLGGRVIPKWLGPSGVDHVMQPGIWDNGVTLYLPNTGTTLGLNYGGPWVGGGTLSHPTPTNTSIGTRMWRTRFANVATTQNQTLGISMVAANTQRVLRGNAAGVGGFFYFCRFIVELIPAATIRLFCGLTDRTTSPVASDTVAGNACGLWHDTTDALNILTFMTRDNTTTTKANITLTGNMAAGQAFDFYMYCAPNDSSVYYRLDDLNAGTTLVDSSTSTTIPTNTAFMGPVAQMSNGTANTTVTTTAIGVNKLYLEADY